MDNRHLSPRELEIFRKKIINAVVKEKFSQTEVARLYGFTRVSVNRYIQAYKKYGEASLQLKRRGRTSDSMSKLSVEMQKQVRKTVETKTPDEVGLKCVLWTRKAVREHIEKTYGVSYAVRSMTDVLHRWGFSPQKPLKVAIQKDPIRVQKWLDEEYVQIKKKAKLQKGIIYWADEMGLSSTDQRGRTYGLVGKTPSIRKTGSRFRCNMIAAISNHGSMKWKVFEDSFTADVFLDFLRRLIYKSDKKIFLVLDNLRVHHSKKAAKWVQKNQDKIEFFFLPPYSPELNPQELVNQEIKGHCQQL